MNAHYVIQPKLSDVLSVISASNQLTASKRLALTSALHSLSKWTGKDPSALPANIQQLGEVFGDLQPFALDISPKTLANVKSLILDAIAISELIPGVVRHKVKGRPRAPEWQALWMRLTKRSYRNGLSRFVRFCDREKLQPEQVSTEAINRFMTFMRETSFRQNQYQLHRTTAKMWNELVDLFPEKGLAKVEVPVSRLHRCRTPMEKFPLSFHQDWANYAAWIHGEDIFADDAHPTRVNQTTLDGYERKIHLAASLMVDTGSTPSSICSLADLTTPDAVKRFLRRRHEITEGKASYETFFVAQLLIRIARDWVKVDVDTLAEIKRLVKKLPAPTFQMTQKNNRLVSRFDDPKLLQKLLSTPDDIWNEMLTSNKKGRWHLAEAQASLGISLLLNTAIRLGNLTALEFDKHLFLRPGGTSTLVLLADETKTGNGVEFDIPEPLAERLIEYRDGIAPKEIGERPTYLFANTDGTVKGFATVRYLVERYVKLYTGVHMNPHAYRHLMAKFILDQSPGAHVLVQHLLGHKKVDTTANFYAGLNTRRAGRHHQALLSRAMTETQANRTTRPVAAR